MNNHIKRIGGLLGLIAIDQLIKYLAIIFLKDKGATVLIPNVLEFLYIENRGAAFGIFQNKQWFFVIISILVLAAIFYFFQKIPSGKRYLPLQLCLYFIGAGAVGNMIDRVLRKYVVDFIYFKLIDFPVFNIADIYVTVACFFLVILLLFYYNDKEFDQIFSLKNKSEKDV